MPLRALSPLEEEWLEEEEVKSLLGKYCTVLHHDLQSLPDYEQLQRKKLDPRRL